MTSSTTTATTTNAETSEAPPSMTSSQDKHLSDININSPNDTTVSSTDKNYRIASPASESVLAGLTENQREAVSIIHGPLLVLAAAGSGKTTVITRRIANMLEQGTPPWNILALTFTNKAAGEMRERIFRLLPDSTEANPGRGMTVTTFHSFCARVLRRYAERIGLKQNYTIYDTADQKSAMKQALARLNLSKDNFPPAKMLSFISNAKNALQTPNSFALDADNFWMRSAAKCYETYQAILLENNAVDFDDLLLDVAALLRDDEEVRASLQHRFRFVLIDEYQDTNHAQFVIARMLAGTADRNICVVGDPDQSIYAWRGADIKNILEFQHHFPDAQTVKLGENFRSTTHILKTADELIKNNKKRQDKPLYTTREGGIKPTVTALEDEHEEAKSIAQFFKEINADHEIPYREMAVFYRTNALSRVLEAEFRKAALPYTIVRGTAFFQRKEIKDALAYLRLIVNPYDEVNLHRIINNPPRGIGAQTIRRIEFFAIDKHLRLFDALRRASEVPGLSKRAINGITKFINTVEQWRALASTPTDQSLNLIDELPNLVTRVIEESGMQNHYKKSDTDEDNERLENLNELISSAAEFEEELMELLAEADFNNRKKNHNENPDESTEDIVPFDNIELDQTNNNPNNDFDPFDDPFGPLGDLTINENPFAPDDQTTQNTTDSSAMEDIFAQFQTNTQDDSNIAPHPTALAKLRVYLERVTLIADADSIDSETGSVLMMTFHASKGLEFQAVAIVGLEEGMLPHMMSRDSDDSVEEERRLFFVGITRAKEHLLITRAKSRAFRGMRNATIPSEFLSELPEDSVNFQGDAFSTSRIIALDFNQMKTGYQAKWSAKTNPSKSPSCEYSVGDRILHPQFGKGTVENITGSSTDPRLQIKFDHVGKKTIVASIARLKRLN